MVFARILQIGCVVVASAACDQASVTPTSPAAAEQQPSPVARAAAIARLELSNGSVAGNEHGWLVRFVLRETSGRSFAVVKAVYVANDDGRVQVTDEGCWRQVIRVEPRETNNTFANIVPDPADVYGSCNPFAYGPTSQLRVTVAFVDDAGAVGAVTASIPTT